MHVKEQTFLQGQPNRNVVCLPDCVHFYCKMIKDAEKGLISPRVMTLIKMSTTRKKIQKDRASSPPNSRIPSCRLYFTWRKAIRSSRLTSRTCTSTLQCK